VAVAAAQEGLGSKLLHRGTLHRDFSSSTSCSSNNSITTNNTTTTNSSSNNNSTSTGSQNAHLLPRKALQVVSNHTSQAISMGECLAQLASAAEEVPSVTIQVLVGHCTTQQIN
jgi:hypothetical protein